VVPYNRKGKRSKSVRMWLDLSPWQEIRLNPKYNCRHKSKEPRLLYVYGQSGGFEPFQTVSIAPGSGVGTVEMYDKVLSGWEITIDGITLLLEGWWLQAAVRGNLSTLPVINMEPKVGIVNTESGDINWVTDEADIARVDEEEALDVEDEESGDLSGLVPLGYQETAGELLLELEDDSEEIMIKLAKMISKMDSTLDRAKCLVDTKCADTENECDTENEFNTENVSVHGDKQAKSDDLF